MSYLAVYIHHQVGHTQYEDDDVEEAVGQVESNLEDTQLAAFTCSVDGCRHKYNISQH